MTGSMQMIAMTGEEPNGFLKNVVHQYWDVGPLSVTLQISNDPKYNYFGGDVEQGWISSCRYREPSRQYEGEETGYRYFINVCDAHNIPYKIADNSVGQMHFYIPSEHKMAFLDGLEAHVAAHG